MNTLNNILNIEKFTIEHTKIGDALDIYSLHNNEGNTLGFGNAPIEALREYYQVQYDCRIVFPEEVRSVLRHYRITYDEFLKCHTPVYLDKEVLVYREIIDSVKYY
jgi:hypothetical protein